jgi:hypothetical protein
MQIKSESRDSLVGIATGCGLDNRGVGDYFGTDERAFFSAKSPDELWGPTNLLADMLVFEEIQELTFETDYSRSV